MRTHPVPLFHESSPVVVATTFVVFVPTGTSADSSSAWRRSLFVRNSSKATKPLVYVQNLLIVPSATYHDGSLNELILPSRVRDKKIAQPVNFVKFMNERRNMYVPTCTLFQLLFICQITRWRHVNIVVLLIVKNQSDKITSHVAYFHFSVEYGQVTVNHRLQCYIVKYLWKNGWW